MKNVQTLAINTPQLTEEQRAIMEAARAWTEAFEASITPVQSKRADWKQDIREFVAHTYDARAAAWTGTAEELAAFKAELQDWLHTHPDPTLSELAELSVRLGADVFCTPLTAQAAPPPDDAPPA